jgi:hypothetical protein
VTPISDGRFVEDGVKELGASPDGRALALIKSAAVVAAVALVVLGIDFLIKREIVEHAHRAFDALQRAHDLANSMSERLGRETRSETAEE